MTIDTDYIKFSDVKKQYSQYFQNKKLYLLQEKIIAELDLKEKDYLWCTTKKINLSK
jgi:hypothetical protein